MARIIRFLPVSAGSDSSSKRSRLLFTNRLWERRLPGAYPPSSAPGLEPFGPTVLWHGNQYVRYEFCIIRLFWTTIWSVKASWLALYWKLFDRLQVYQRWLKVVVVFVSLSYAGYWVAISVNCHPPSAYFNFDDVSRLEYLRNGDPRSSTWCPSRGTRSLT